MATFFSQAWADAVKDAWNAGPSPKVKAGKLQEYWDWIEFARLGVNGTLGLGVRDLPATAGADGDTLVLTLDTGKVSDARVVDREEAREVCSFLLVGPYADWRDLLSGYDVTKTVMYRKFALEKGDVLDFFNAVYLWVEYLAVIGTVPAELPTAA